MVSEIQQVIAEFVQRGLNIPFVPPFSYERGLLRDDGGPNRFFSRSFRYGFACI